MNFDLTVVNVFVLMLAIPHSAYSYMAYVALQYAWAADIGRIAHKKHVSQAQITGNDQSLTLAFANISKNKNLFLALELAFNCLGVFFSQL